jgi:hypothetical protein
VHTTPLTIPKRQDAFAINETLTLSVIALPPGIPENELPRIQAPAFAARNSVPRTRLDHRDLLILDHHHYEHVWLVACPEETLKWGWIDIGMIVQWCLDAPASRDSRYTSPNTSGGLVLLTGDGKVRIAFLNTYTSNSRSYMETLDTSF